MAALPNDPPLPNEVIELVAERFAALGDPTRVRLLDALRRHGEASVGELASEAGAGYANAAKHLSLLHRARVVARRKEGARVLYRIGDGSVLTMCELVCGSVAAHARELEALVAGRLPGPETKDVEHDREEVHA